MGGPAAGRHGMNEERCDVAIIGAGPAGATAAGLLAAKGRRVLLIDRAKFPRPAPCAGWLSSGAIPLLQELGIGTKPITDRAFRDVTFYRADFSQKAKPAFAEPAGFLIDRKRFDHELVRAAVRAGATLVEGAAAAKLKLKESAVIVELANQRRLESRLLLIAAGRGSELLERAGIPLRSAVTPLWIAQVEAEVPRAVAPKTPYVGIVLGLDQSGSFALCCVGPERLSLGVNWMGESREVIPTLVRVCGQMFGHGAVPVDLSQQAATATVIRSPASAALDMDTHVGKHTLVIGEAGGFIAAVSSEGIYPAMWSAQIASQVAHEALDSVHSQDALMSFDSQWRMKMADYLRSPHTDIQFLLPLIFTNQPMADRMGAAFFHGENI